MAKVNFKKFNSDNLDEYMRVAMWYIINNSDEKELDNYIADTEDIFDVFMIAQKIYVDDEYDYNGIMVRLYDATNKVGDSLGRCIEDHQRGMDKKTRKAEVYLGWQMVYSGLSEE